MDENQLIENEVHRIHHSRNRKGYLPNLLSIGASTFFQHEKLVAGKFWIWSLGLAFAGTLLRVLIGEKFFEQWKKKLIWARGLNILGFALMAIGWGLHFYDVTYHFELYSPSVSFTLLIIFVILTGAWTSLLADKWSYFSFTYTLTICVALTYLIDSSISYAFVLFNVFLFIFFSFSSFKLSHQQLRELITSKIRTASEKERLINIIDAVPGFVGLINKDQIYYMANRATLSLYPDIIGRKLGTLERQADWERKVIEFLASDKTSEVCPASALYKGHEIHALLNFHKMSDGGAIIVSIITTELVEAQKKLREQEAKAQYASKLASLGEMAAGIAHEVNNPLTIIQGSAMIINRAINETPLDVSTIKLLTEKMIETSGRISKTIRSLKALSRNGENDPKRLFSLRESIHQCLDISNQRLKNGNVELIINEIDPGLLIYGREVELGQVLINLINNAVDAVQALPERWIKLSVETGEYVDIFIVDSGKGIPQSLEQRIMEPFFTTKDVNQGTGLGLSISKRIIEDHGGELTYLKDKPHTTFRIRLPLKK